MAASTTASSGATRGMTSLEELTVKSFRSIHLLRRQDRSSRVFFQRNFRNQVANRLLGGRGQRGISMPYFGAAALPEGPAIPNRDQAQRDSNRRIGAQIGLVAVFVDRPDEKIIGLIILGD